MDPVGSVDRSPAVVFGAGGFVGRAVCAALLAAGRPVTAVLRSPADLPAGCRALPLDAVRCDPAALAAGLGALRPGLVVNAAGALWNVTDRELTEGNVLLVERLVRAVTTLPGPVRLVHIGSAYEYGAQAGPSRLTETLHARPAGRYAQTKLAGTRIVTEAAAGGLLDAVVLRIAVAVGPFASRHSLLGGLARQLAEGPVELTLPPIAGVRDLVDVRDVADAVLAAARVRRAPALVNIGSGTGVRLTEAVDTLIRIAGPRAATARVVRGPAPTVRRDTGIGEQALDIGLARRELGWAPARTLTDALHALWDSVQDTAPASPTTLAATLAVDGETIHG